MSTEPTTPTRVIFRSFTEYGTATDPDGVIALFPDEQHDRTGRTIDSYMHHGQHGAADPALIATLYTTTPTQRAPLVAELQSLRYVLDVDTTTPGRLPRPYAADRGRYAAYDRFRALRRNSDAADAVRERVPFANRSHSLSARTVYVPVGATFDRVDGGRVRTDGDIIAHIRITTPSDPRTGTSTTEILTTAALPPAHVSALLASLVGVSRNPNVDNVYVASSYDTPILWAAGLEPDSPVTMPRVRYSATTTRHQEEVTGGTFTSTESARDGRGSTPFGTGWQSRTSRR